MLLLIFICYEIIRSQKDVWINEDDICQITRKYRINLNDFKKYYNGYKLVGYYNRYNETETYTIKEFEEKLSKSSYFKILLRTIRFKSYNGTIEPENLIYQISNEQFEKLGFSIQPIENKETKLEIQ